MKYLRDDAKMMMFNNIRKNYWSKYFDTYNLMDKDELLKIFIE